MRLLYPHYQDAVDPIVIYSDLPSAVGRPSVRLNMIVSVDGGTSWNGVSGGLGGPADKALFAVMRTLPDVVLVASGTMRAERYGPAVLPDHVQAARRSRGQRPVPPIAVVSRRCEFDWNDAFFAAAHRGDFDALVAVLDPDVVLRSDGGEKRPALSFVRRGATEVARTAVTSAQPAAVRIPVS